MLAEFSLTIFYTQVTVCVSGAPLPALAWADEHVAQGFAWSPSAVSFGVPDHDAECLMQVEAAPGVNVEPQALWAIRVPFVVPGPSLKIGSVFAEHEVKVPAGKYSLVFEVLPGNTIEDRDYTYVFKLKFSADPHPDFEILKQGGELTTDKVLRRDA